MSPSYEPDRDTFPPFEPTEESFAAVREMDDIADRAAWVAFTALGIVAHLAGEVGMADSPGRVGVAFQLTDDDAGATAYGATADIDGPGRADELSFWANVFRNECEAAGLSVSILSGPELRAKLAESERQGPMPRRPRGRHRRRRG